MSEGKPKPARTAMSSQRLTIAMPFSQIKTQEPSQDLRALARIVSALADEIAKMQPSDTTNALAEQAQALLAHIES